MRSYHLIASLMFLMLLQAIQGCAGKIEPAKPAQVVPIVNVCGCGQHCKCGDCCCKK